MNQFIQASWSRGLNNGDTVYTCIAHISTWDFNIPHMGIRKHLLPTDHEMFGLFFPVIQRS